jgi:hypothetical protein
MGTKMVPSYANIFMGDLEERLLLSSLKQPLSWFRFIDNVDMKWIHKDKELDEFFEHANSIHPSIKFTHEVSKTKMSFLDTTTTVKEGNMATDLYSKPTDKHLYLSPSSCHPKTCFKSIPFSQAIKVKRICSTRLAAASDKVYQFSCLPMVGGSLRVLRLPPPLKLVAMI